LDVACADAFFFNGKVYTLESERALVRAMAVEDGRIVALGEDREVRRAIPRGADKFDLGGKPVVPGFIDCHTHFVQMGVDLLNVDLSQAESIEDALALMKDRAATTPEGEWVVGANWKESAWKDGRFITRADLDKHCPDHPAVAHRVCGHLSSVNSKAISALGIDDKTPDADVASGILKESAVGLVRRATEPDRARKSKALGAALRKASSLGVTSVHDNGDASDLDLYASYERQGKLSVRVWFNTPSRLASSRTALSLAHGVGSQWLKVGGVKVFCDGALGARTAALSEPFADDPGNRGMLVHSEEELRELVELVDGAGIQLAIHAIGDRGIETTIAALEDAVKVSRRRDLRHRIEHLELPNRSHLSRMRRLRMIASMQPNFVGEWGGIEGMYVSRLGTVRASRNNPFREVLKAGVRLVFGSDCMPMSPIYGIHSAANAPHPAQRITAPDALACYTSSAAFASFEEAVKGTLSVGKLADFVVLSDDMFDDPRRISGITVLKTVVGGRTVFGRRP